MSKATQFLKGARLGMPIALGYIPVSFSFGMLAVQNGIPAWAAIVISMTNLTSAGQFAGMNIISAAGGMWEMAITTFVINLRYMLMSLSLSQKIGKMSLAKRLITAFGITDEVFAVASTTPIAITFPFMLGLIAIPYIGWTLGTVGITLYAMFIAIIIPASRRDKNVLFVLIAAVILSCVLYFALPFISSGWAVIITAVLASAFGATFFPHNEEGEK